MRLLNMPNLCPFKVGDKVSYRGSYGGVVVRIEEHEGCWMLHTDDDDAPWYVSRTDKNRSGMELWKGDV